MENALFREVRRPSDIDWLFSDAAWKIYKPNYSKEEYIRSMKEYIIDDSIELYVCLVHGVRVGILTLQKPRRFEQFRILWIAVHEDYRLRGIGRFMIEQLVELYSELGVFIRVFTSIVYDDTIVFFRKCGFGEIAYDASDCSGNQWAQYCCYIDI